MGQKHLRIVASDAHTEKGALNTAYESHDILKSIEVFESLEAATTDMDLVIGTTGKSRKLRYEVLLSYELPKFMDEKATAVSRVALVFGSETNGLSKEEENGCDVLTTIPMSTDYPSINLSHSVMVYAYELSKRISSQIERNSTTNDRGEVFKAVKEQSRALLTELNMPNQQPGLFRRIMDKIPFLNESDSRLVLSLLRYLKKIGRESN